LNPYAGIAGGGATEAVEVGFASMTERHLASRREPGRVDPVPVRGGNPQPPLLLAGAVLKGPSGGAVLRSPLPRGAPEMRWQEA
jgi:hypothetical protein